jgi:hypothetical protein
MAKKRGAGYLMLMTLVMIGVFYYFSQLNFPEQNTVVASIDERNITRSQLKDFSMSEFGVFDEEIGREVLDIMVNHAVLLIHADKKGIIKNILQPRFDKQIKYARERIMLDAFFFIDAEKAVEVSAQEMRRYYDTQPLFLLRAMLFDYSAENAFEVAELASRELNKLQNFREVHHLVFGNEPSVLPDNLGVQNFNKLPPHLEEVKDQIASAGTATMPLADEYGFIVYYRDEKPGFLEARDSIRNVLMAEKMALHKEQRHDEVIRNNRINYFIVNNLLQRSYLTNPAEVLVTNRLTDDSLTSGELAEKLSDLYQLTIFELSKEEIVDFINLFIGQKVILSIAEENDFFRHSRFLRPWEQERQELLENQSAEIINYMLDDFYENHVKAMTDSAIEEIYHKNADLYRMSELIRLQTIVTNNRNTAIQAYNEALATGDFDAAVLKYSIDPFVQFSRGVGMYLNDVELGRVYEIVRGREIGEIIQPIEVEVGIYHIHKVIDIVAGAVKPIGEVKTQLQTKLAFIMMEDYIQDIINTHRIRVKIFEENIAEPERQGTSRGLKRFIPEDLLKRSLHWERLD